MTAHETATDFVLFFSAKELAAQQLCHEEVTDAQLLPFLRSHLSQMQKSMPLYPSIELFPSKAGLLVFIRSALSCFPTSSMNPRIFS